MVNTSLNRMMSAYTVRFDTWEEAHKALGKALKKLNETGRLSVLDLNPNEQSYFKEYGWLAPAQFTIEGCEIGVRRKYTFFGDYESIDLLELSPEIIDILRNEGISQISQISEAIRSAGKTGKLPIYGIGTVYSEKIRTAYEKYQLKSINKDGEINDNVK